MTPFELALQKANAGEIKTPLVTIGNKPIDYFKYQLTTHHFNLKLLAKGLKFKNIKFTDIKKYYGLTGRTAADCLPQFQEILTKYT